MPAEFDYTYQGEYRYMYAPGSGAAPFLVNTSELAAKLGHGDAASSLYSDGRETWASEGVVTQPPASVMMARPLSSASIKSVRSVRDTKYF